MKINEFFAAAPSNGRIRRKRDDNNNNKHDDDDDKECDRLQKFSFDLDLNAPYTSSHFSSMKSISNS